MQSCERAAIAFSAAGKQRIDGSDLCCLECASESKSTLLGAVKALQPFGCFDGFAFQFVSRKNAGGFWPQVKTDDLVLPDLASMGGLNTSLLISTQALETAQGAITATSNNIANANTPGYTREVPQFTESPLSQTGSTVIGGGVSLTGLQSVRDELLNLQIQNQTSLQSSADTQSSLLQQIQTNFTTTGGDITSALSAFSSSLAELSANPSSSAVQQGVISSGQNLARAFNTTANGLTSAQSDADTQVTQTVAQINSLTAQIAQLNGQVAQLTAAGKDGGTAEDQRDELVSQLSKLTGVSVMQTSDGETITTGNGTPLVMGNQSFSLQTTTGSDGMQHVLDFSGTDITTSITGWPAWRRNSASGPGDSRLSDATQHSGEPVHGELSMLPRRRGSIQTAMRARISSAVTSVGRRSGHERGDQRSIAGGDQFRRIRWQQWKCSKPFCGAYQCSSVRTDGGTSLRQSGRSGGHSSIERKRAVNGDWSEPSCS